MKKDKIMSILPPEIQAAIAPIKATAGGNLNRAFVNLIMSDMILDADYKDMIFFI